MVEIGDAFCGACGTSLRQSLPEDLVEGANRGSPGERRRVSILFCDLVGYTALSDQRDPEESRQLLSGYFDVARAIVARYGGVIEKFIGDAVMAAWGAPEAHEDDAERAVRAALELVDAVAAYGERLGQGLLARVGVASGSTVTASPQDGIVVGDRVNLAARVQSAASPGTCYVDEMTSRLAGRALLFEFTGEYELKGIAEPVRLFRAVRVVSGMGGRDRAAGLEAPLVGRDIELRAVKDLFHACVERSVPRLIVISGPAGVGKSRLGWELEKYIDGLVETVVWHRGRCLSYGEGVSFWALAEMVRQRLAIAEEDPTEVAAAKLSEGLVRLIPAEERASVGLRVGRLLGVSDADERAIPLSQEDLFAGWRLFFERLAAVAPVVLMVDDAQHADDGLLAFIDHVVDWARGLPILIVVLARPELIERHPGFGVGRNRTILSLDPLDDSSMDRLVDGLVPGLPNEARLAVTSRAQGIPLFAVETVKSLLDGGLLAPLDDGTGYRLVRELDRIEVPDTLHGLLTARLDALDVPTRELISVASVLGSSFPAEALVAVSGRGDQQVREALAELVRRDVLEVMADQLSPQRGDYRFSQPLLRQVAYEIIPRRERKARHLAVAAHLRSTFARDGEEVSEVIAQHYLDALAAAPTDKDAGDIRSDAIALLERAASRASTAGAPSRAADSFATAARLVSESGSPDEVQPLEAVRRGAGLWERACEAAYVAGQHGRAAEYALLSRSGYKALGDERGYARTLVREGSCVRQAGQLNEARILIEEALTVLRQMPDADTVEAVSTMAGIEVFSGHIDKGDRLSSEAVELAQAVGVGDRSLAGVFIGRGINLGSAGRTAEAAAYLREAANIAERVGSSFDMTRALLNLADSLGGYDPLGSAEAAEAAVRHARRIGANAHLAFATSNLISALLELGRWPEVDELMQQAEADDLMDDIQLSCLRGLLAAIRGDLDTAAASVESAADSASEYVQDQAIVSCTAAFAAAARSDQKDALRHALAVVDLAENLGYRQEAIRWAWPLAVRTAIEIGDSATVNRLLDGIAAVPPGHLPPVMRASRDLFLALTGRSATVSESIAALRSANHPYALASGLLDQADYLGRSGDRAAAGESLDEAKAIAEHLGARLMLDRADRLQADMLGTPARQVRT